MFGIPPYLKVDNNKLVTDLDDLSIFTLGHLIRTTENALLELYRQGRLSGTIHTAIGQEICQLSVARCLINPYDSIFSNHRNHGHFLTYSGQVGALISEIMGKNNGVCRGRGGSQNLSFNRFHSSGIQAGFTGIANGFGLADKFNEEKDAVIAVMIGDGTLGQGLLYESMNLSSIWNLPILFVLENNGIAQTTETINTIGGSIEMRGRAFGLNTWHLSDKKNNFLLETQKIVDQIRIERSPGLLIIDTNRMGPHSKGDDFRDQSIISDIIKNDPLNKLKENIDKKTISKIEKRNKDFVNDIIEIAWNSEDAYLNEEDKTFFIMHDFAIKKIDNKESYLTVRESLNSCMDKMLENNKVVLIGEDLHDPYGGAFKVTNQLSTKYPKQVISTPISEAAFTGSAIGLAMRGFFPIVEIMFSDFLTLAIDQILNYAVKIPWMFEDEKVPIVIRSPGGGNRGYGPTHSQSLENIMLGIPGLTIIEGSHRHEIDNLLFNATLNWPYPVLFLENKLLYDHKRESHGYRVIPSSKEDIINLLFPAIVSKVDNPDITIITYGGNLPMVEEVSKVLFEEEEIASEIVVPSILSSAGHQLIVKYLIHKKLLVFIEDVSNNYGYSAEIVAKLYENGFRGKTKRIGALDIPIPASRSIENVVLPQKDSILKELRELFK